MLAVAAIALVALTSVACKRQPDPGVMGVWTAFKERLVLETQAAVTQNWAFRGLSTGKTTLNVFDFDHTLVDTRTRVPVVDDTGNRREIDSKCLSHALNEKPDYSVFDRENTYAYRPIETTLNRLRAYTGDGQQLSVVLTARSGRRTLSMVQEYLWQRGAEPDAVLATNHPRLHKAVWSTIATKDGDKKPLVIAALIELLRNEGNQIGLVRYFEDTDKYLSKGMAFLPKLYPGVRFEFYDYIRGKTPAYKEVFVAYGVSGQLYRPDGVKFEREEQYASGDCPLR